MKTIREYHIEHYWQEEALKREQRSAIKERAFIALVIVAFVALNAVMGYEFLDLLFEVI